MLSYTIKSSKIRNLIYIPKYYDPDLLNQLNKLSSTHELCSLGQLIDDKTISVQTGHEIGKMAYGTGNIPFVRTSDITNWEIKTIPKQGVSDEVYRLYAEKEDVQVGDVLLVRDGTYLIGTNCIVTEMDIPMLYQSHILKFRVNNDEFISPYLLFLAFNNPLVQKQIRNLQFTADIIDTLGNRFREIVLPIPKSSKAREELSLKVKNVLENRIKHKAAIKQMPIIIEKVLSTNSTEAFDSFFKSSVESIVDTLVQDTTTLEFGTFSAYHMKCSEITNSIFLPKYYDPSITKELSELQSNCSLLSIQDLIDKKIIEISTGDEIGKMAYGTGNIPFVRTSDFSNWEIKADTKQGVSEEIYAQFEQKEDVKPQDILIVRDGTYLVGTSCMITESDKKMLFCGGLIKIRVINKEYLNPYLLLGLLNSYIVKRQIRTKQFTRDVIDTIGQRFGEVIIPIPNSNAIQESISSIIKKIIHERIAARDSITSLSQELVSL